MEAYDPYDSIRFHAWNHDLHTYRGMKRHEIIVWNYVVPCMESHGRLMNLDPGNADHLIAQWHQKLFDHFVIFQVLDGKLLYLMQKKIFLYLFIPTHSCKYLQLQGSEESK